MVLVRMTGIVTTKQFFITGLPRSRTAWLANFLSTGDVICLHEATVQEFEDVIASGNYTHVGLAHTKLYEIMDIAGASPVLVIDRDPEEVWEWAKYYCTKEWFEYLYYKTTSIEAFRVPFHGINKNLRDIWKHLIGTPMDATRAAYLQDYNVQVTNERLEELIG